MLSILERLDKTSREYSLVDTTYIEVFILHTKRHFSPKFYTSCYYNFNKKPYSGKLNVVITFGMKMFSLSK